LPTGGRKEKKTNQFSRQGGGEKVRKEKKSDLLFLTKEGKKKRRIQHPQLIL